MLLTGESRYRLSRQLVPQFDCRIYKGIFTDVYSLFPGHNFLMIYLLTAIGLSPGGSSTVHIYTQTIRRAIQKNNT